MINFLANVFNDKANILTMCGDFNNDNGVIQECAGCDDSCFASCDADCANDCQALTQDTGGGGGSCNSNCRGSCFSLASIMGEK